jgi:preprotein translocase subunit SecB
MALPPAQLEDTWVARLAFDENREFDRADSQNTSYAVEPRVEIGELIKQNDGAIEATVRLGANVVFSREDDQEGPLPFGLAIEICGLFRWEPDVIPPEDHLASAWLEYNGMYLLWPYLRSHIAAVTAMSRLPTLTIYTMNTPKPPVIPQPEIEGSAGERAELDAATGTDEPG